MFASFLTPAIFLSKNIANKRIATEYAMQSLAKLICFEEKLVKNSKNFEIAKIIFD